MARLSKILFAILIGFSFVVGTATASPIGRHRRRRHRRHGFKHAGKRVGHGGKRVGKGVGHAGRKTGRKIKHIVT